MARNKYPEETERKILEVSFRLFNEKGYDDTTIQDIVDALGMSKGAVYHHFKSKEDILNRLYDNTHVGTSLFDILDDPSLSGLEKLREILHRQLTDPGKLAVDAVPIAYQKNPRLLQLLLNVSVREGGATLQATLEQGIQDGSITTPYPKETAESLLLLLNLWVGIFSEDKEDFLQKLSFLKAMTDALGVPVFDETLMSEAERYFDCLASKFQSQT